MSREKSRHKVGHWDTPFRVSRSQSHPDHPDEKLRCQLCDTQIRSAFLIRFVNGHFRDLSGVQYQVCSRCYTRTLQGLKRYRRQELEKSNKKDMVVV